MTCNCIFFYCQALLIRMKTKKLYLKSLSSLIVMNESINKNNRYKIILL